MASLRIFRIWTQWTKVLRGLKIQVAITNQSPRTDLTTPRSINLLNNRSLKRFCICETILLRLCSTLQSLPIYKWLMRTTSLNRTIRTTITSMARQRIVRLIQMEITWTMHRMALIPMVSSNSRSKDVQGVCRFLNRKLRFKSSWSRQGLKILEHQELAQRLLSLLVLKLVL